MTSDKLPRDLREFLRSDSPEEALALSIDFERLPAHVAIIMDGNGRWATSRRLPRVAGHRAGIDAVRDVVESSARLGLKVLTLYAFSQENWKRPRTEISTLMALLKEYVRRELQTLLRNNIRFQVIGRFHELDPSVRAHLERGMEATRHCTGLLFNIALSYGGRSEILDACRGLLEAARAGNVDPANITEEDFASHLYTAGQPDPDLLIRTSGELRISNFLLWQIAYAEIWVTPTLWPDFRAQELLQAIVDYQKRERRYGGVDAVKRRVV
ncbi:MAG: isoprenyl transferase [Acidobacteria bacterium]|nr:isoprenyl transferase [Acidobacteriota bacterium]